MDDRTIPAALEQHWDVSDAAIWPLNMKSITRTPCWIIRSRASGSAGGAIFKRAGWCSLTKSASRSGE